MLVTRECSTVVVYITHGPKIKGSNPGAGNTELSNYVVEY
jgi:hypothetical protein